MSPSTIRKVAQLGDDVMAHQVSAMHDRYIENPLKLSVHDAGVHFAGAFCVVTIVVDTDMHVPVRATVDRHKHRRNYW